MELKEFVTQTLTQIVEGVKDAQEQIKETGALINPNTCGKNGIVAGDVTSNEIRNVQNVKMNIAVTTTENVGSKSGAGVMVSALKVGASKDKLDTNTKTSYVEFDIPISFPVSQLK